MNEEALTQLYLKETSFQDLMQSRIHNVLLIASPYDAFMMEEDGRVEEQLYFEYVALNLSSPPRITRVADRQEALEALAAKHYDLVIAMPGADVSDTFADARAIKKQYPDIPIVVLTPFSREVSRRLQSEDMTGIDYVFSWLGNVDLLLAIIKLLEDKMNAEHDIRDVGVQMIMVVEDSVRFYSSVLPHIYKFLLRQSQVFSTEALNEHEQMLRMRGRPKVMLARDYEEAMALAERYGNKMLGVISDVSFKRNGVKDTQAGLQLARSLRHRDPYLPIIIESSEVANRGRVTDFGGIFVDKNSKKLPVDLGEAIMANFGFGDLIIRNPNNPNEELMRISSLSELQRRVFDIPAEALRQYAANNGFSRWLYSRALFPIAEVMRRHSFRSLDEAPAVRQLIFDLIVKYRKMKNRGVVAVFKRGRFDHYSNFARIGQGSLGGKARGLAFVDAIIKKNPVCDNYEGVSISIPRTVVLCTDIFDEFMASNKLYALALSDASDDEILQRFLQAQLPERIWEDIYALLQVLDCPVAVRSSSLLEDSHYQPFAGIYATYMVPGPKACGGISQMFAQVSDAIKGVYASVFYSASKAYMNATRNVIDQEKMAIIIQEVVGSERDGGYYFPSFAGVGRSLNYYPIGAERPEDGVAQVAIGLGKYIVDGGMALRFSPRHPANVLQTSTLDLALRDTQTRLCALRADRHDFSINEGYNIESVPVQQFAGKPVLDYMVSTYHAQDGMLIDNNLGPGRRVVTFANILAGNMFPLAEAVDFMLSTGQAAMRRPIEIEFAGQIDMPPGTPVANTPQSRREPTKGHIYWLQIRPIIDRKDMVEDTLFETPDDQIIVRSDTALGHGAIDAIHSIVYVRPDTFSSLNNPAIAAEIAEINKRFVADGKNYILIGPGRWGSSDNALGIPVRWSDIAAARLIVEASLGNYRMEPSQGTHFFQNLTSFGVGYLTVNPFDSKGLYDTEYLDSLPADYESDHVRVVTFQNPLRIGIDGRRGIGVVLKPENQSNTIGQSPSPRTEN